MCSLCRVVRTSDIMSGQSVSVLTYVGSLAMHVTAIWANGISLHSKSQNVDMYVHTVRVFRCTSDYHMH